MGVGSLLKKYTALLCTHIGDILPVAASIASASWRHFAEVASIVEGDFTGTVPVCCLRTLFSESDESYNLSLPGNPLPFALCSVGTLLPITLLSNLVLESDHCKYDQWLRVISIIDTPVMSSVVIA